VENHLRVDEVPELERLGNVVPDGYSYYEKVVEPRDDLRLRGAYLKWYDIRPADVEITEAQREETRAYLRGEAESGRLKLDGELGFVLLHRAGSVLLLLVTTWRNTNEMWESVYVKDPGKAEGYRQITFDDHHKATYCVWELGPIWHERDAWVRFLSSKRDVEAKLRYINDRFRGVV
jgi:hypothetical protein